MERAITSSFLHIHRNSAIWGKREKNDGQNHNDDMNCNRILLQNTTSRSMSHGFKRSQCSTNIVVVQGRGFLFFGSRRVASSVRRRRHSIDVRLSPFLDHPRQSVRLEGVELGRSLRHRVLPRCVALFSAGRDVVTSAWCSIPDQAQRAVVVARQRHASNILPATQTPPTLAGYNTAADGLAICRRHDRLPESPLTSDGRVSLGGETKAPNTRGSF